MNVDIDETHELRGLLCSLPNWHEVLEAGAGHILSHLSIIGTRVPQNLLAVHDHSSAFNFFGLRKR